MNLEGMEDSASRFASFVEQLTSVIGHADRARPLNDYCTGLLVSEGRKSVEPMAAVTAPAETSVQHQRLLHFVANAPWSDEAVLAKVRELVLPAIERHGPIGVWIVDDTSFPKCGSHSVGVHHQYCGQLGKQANCQVAVTLSVANHHASLPIAYRLYLPQEWAQDARRRKKARIPKEISFKTKPQIALEQIEEALAAGVPPGTVITDASYGTNSSFRAGITAQGLKYVAAIIPTMMVRRVCNDGALGVRQSVKTLARRLPKKAWRTITWREGTNKKLRSRFARVQVHTAPIRGAAARGEETLLIEWPKGEPEPTKYWLSTLDKDIPFCALVDCAKMRWRVERDYLELKQEIGLGHYEGRGWPGFHHHGTLCIATYGFAISERETIPPSGAHCAWRIKKPAIPDSYRPRGAADPTPTARSQLNRYPPSSVARRDRKDTSKMPLLRKPIPQKRASQVVTQ
ncbi:MAG TPA: IS701 family transposase [Pseudolabrys sp.]|nr:IS701 family transposase [Pseudolabrys sp.]